jgi:hypothetical protein
MKKLLLIIAAAFVLASCSSNDKVLSEKEMARVLRDIHLADGAYDTQRYAQNRFENIDSLYLYKGVFEKNGVSREEFVNSLKYYSKYPRRLEDIYTMVVNDLSAKQAKMRAELDKKSKAQKPKGAK